MSFVCLNLLGGYSLRLQVIRAGVGGAAVRYADGIEDTEASGMLWEAETSDAVADSSEDEESAAVTLAEAGSDHEAAHILA
eukprot:CAMPEP_0182873640 /NCGR_PEP_ID=MMETSP0034_2-20130328/12457_1 /TAXON_ID=156128 /ORGANISM="Nephroselmis pyriformis, Strain CCMP717" /LENGTH=80 /DNA_ID=CAMNT_0025006301 /DNA_START=113 /DNA_END=351 /DNA_ORIENTATION=+